MLISSTKALNCRVFSILPIKISKIASHPSLSLSHLRRASATGKSRLTLMGVEGCCRRLRILLGSFSLSSSSSELFDLFPIVPTKPLPERSATHRRRLTPVKSHLHQPPFLLLCPLNHHYLALTIAV